MTKKLVLLLRAVGKCFGPAAWQVIVANGAVELAHRKVHALSVDLIVEVPGAVDVCFQDIAAPLVMDNEGGDPALAHGEAATAPITSSAEINPTLR
ncbi:hypothetical protein [Bradyrhizobium sp. sGM-13]|uniref:hypothetical protein n=1 Tax=Bradyrhizobium sp. sGM-13 TaxID=2831781 RepID=UPI001BCBBA84|nr:hypothetical protein [Bradyrhizobium sp. sGM-13]